LHPSAQTSEHATQVIAGPQQRMSKIAWHETKTDAELNFGLKLGE